jgi:hypothetical protein
MIYDSGSSVGCGCQSGFANNEVGTVYEGSEVDTVYEGSPVTPPATNQLDPTPTDE